MCAFIPARANSSSGAPAAAESSAPASRARLSDRDHWLTAGQFLNAVALGQVTLGPVVQTVAVVGYSAAGIGGGLLAALVAFSPSFAFVLLGAQRFDRLRTNENAKTFLNGAGPAAIGAILGTAIPLARALSEPWQYGILAAAFALVLFARSGVVRTLLLAGLAGVVIAIADGQLPDQRVQDTHSTSAAGEPADSAPAVHRPPRYCEGLNASRGRTECAESLRSSVIRASRMERLWSLAVATGGNPSQIGTPRNGSNKPKPLPPVATSCRSERMVRRGRRFESVRGLCKVAANQALLLALVATASGLDVHRASTARRRRPVAVDCEVAQSGA